MGFEAHVLKALIASPGDTTPERDAIERALSGWNGSRAQACGVTVMAWRWEHHAVPLLGGSAQAMINAQAVDDCDIVFAVFDARLGTATEDAVSGTAEEITRANNAGKPVHVWFSDEPLPRSTTAAELKRLEDFKAQMRHEGLLGSYANPEDLQYQVHKAIERDVNALELTLAPARPSNAVPGVPRAVTTSVQPNPLGDGLWNVMVHNASGGPIADLDVNVYLVDARGDRTDEKCVPAKGHQSLGDLMGKVVQESLRGGMGSLPGVGGFGGGNPIADQLTPRVRDEMLKHVHAHMQDSFPAVLPPGKDATVVYLAEGNGEVRADITFVDEAGTTWTRPYGQAPKVQ